MASLDTSSQSNATVSDSSVSNATAPVPVWIAHATQLQVWFGITLTIVTIGSLLNMLLFATIVQTAALRKGSGLLIAHGVLVDLIICTVHASTNTFMTFTGAANQDKQTYCKLVLCT